MKLLAMQRDMRAWLTGTEAAATRFATCARAGLGVHQNNYRAQLVSCLSETFERVQAWVGEGAFLAAAARHIDARPPSDWTLDNYGSDFPQTLRELYPLDPEVAELAWLDHALAEAFVAPDVDPLSIDSLAAIDWEDAVFQFTPTAKLGQVITNSTTLWSRLSSANTLPVVETLPRAATIIVWRKEFTSCFRTLDATEATAFAHFQTGGTFGALCATLVATEGETAGVKIAGEILAQWLRDGLVVGVSDSLEGIKLTPFSHLSRT
jgi:hypothetical protein